MRNKKLSEDVLAENKYLKSMLSQMKHRNLFISGLLWAAVAYNMGVVTFTTTDIIRTFNVNRSLAGLLISVTLIGWFFGSIVFGHVSDKYGRKKVVIYASIMHIIATSLMAVSLSYILFLSLRFIAGMGFGMVLPVLSAWVSEDAPAEKRGRMVVLLDSFWTYGWIIASLFAYLYLPALGTKNWSVYYLISLIWLIGIPFALKLHEVPTTRERVRFIKVLQYKYTYALWAVWFAMAFSYYGMFVWLPRIFSDNFPLIKSYEFIFLTYLAQIPGYYTAAYLVEKIGRRYVIFSFMLLTSLSAFLFITNYLELSLVAAFLLSFFDLGAWGALYAITPELYPRESKGTGAGLASSSGRIGGIIGPLIPGLLAWFPSFIIFTMMLLFSSFLAFLMPETKGYKN